MEIGHLKMNVMVKDTVGVRGRMAQQTLSPGLPSPFSSTFMCLCLSELAQSPGSNKLPSISQTCFQSCLALPLTQACAVPIATAFNRVERTSPRFTADKNTSAVCARRSRWCYCPLPRACDCRCLQPFSQLHQVKVRDWKMFVLVTNAFGA